MISAQAETYSKVFLVVDALDECQEHPLNTRQDFLQAIQELPSRIKLLVTSRTHMGLERLLHDPVEISIEAQKADLRIFVSSRLRAGERINRLMLEAERTNPGFREFVIEKIVERAQKRFILAKSDMDCLVAHSTVGFFRKALEELPDITTTYDKALERIEREEPFRRQLAKHGLSWLLFSATPLTVQAVCHAFAVGDHSTDLDRESIPEEDDLTSACAGIVVVEKNSKLLRPMHETAKSYLMKSPEKIPGEEHIASVCLNYLLYDAFRETARSESELEQRIKYHALLKYAANHWAHHFRHAGKNERLKSLALRFLRNSAKITSSFQVTTGFSNIPHTVKGVTGLHAAAYYNLQDMAECLLLDWPDINAACSKGQTALHWSAKYGRHALVDKLLRAGADPNCRDLEKNTPVHLAVMGEHISVIKVLVKKGVRLDVWNKQWTPFRWALKHGLRSETLLLAESRAEVNLVGNDGWSTLRFAMSYAELNVVELLIQHGENVGRECLDGWTPVGEAAMYGKVDLLRLLLKNGAPANIPDRDGFTPLRHAVRYRCTPAVVLLLEHGADKDIPCKAGLTPLMQAVLSGFKPL
ncbi:ankyrin repeat-containing domain protein, partial [Colletotrichum cereale]